MKIIEEFTEFLEDYRVIGLAVAFIIGLAVNDLVKATVDDLFMPVIGIFLTGSSWETAELALLGAQFRIGHFMEPYSISS